MHPIHVGPYESLIFQLILYKLKETMIIKRTINSSAYLQREVAINATVTVVIYIVMLKMTN